MLKTVMEKMRATSKSRWVISAERLKNCRKKSNGKARNENTVSSMRNVFSGLPK